MISSIPHFKTMDSKENRLNTRLLSLVKDTFIPQYFLFPKFFENERQAVAFYMVRF